MRKTVVRLLCNPKLAVDEDGNLYRINQHDVAKELMPKIHPNSGVHGRGNLYYYVQIDGKRVRFSRDDLKELQHKAIGKLL